MVVLGVMLLLGLAITIRWGGTDYEPWEPEAVDGQGPENLGESGDRAPSVKAAALRYLRGVAIALVGGFWAGALVTGPAVRLIMRLLAATAGDDAQGMITEAEEVVGNIDFDGTLGLYLFGGVLPGLLSGAIYVVFRRWLPKGRLGGVAFGLLHLVIAATRIDPLRPENPDFDLVGPGWLSVTTFALAAVLHGMAVVAIANRYSTRFPPKTSGRRAWARALAPLVLPVLLLVPGAFLVLPILLGLVIAVLASRVTVLVRALRSRAAVVGGRIALTVLTLALLPGAVSDLRQVITRDPAVVSSEEPGAAHSRGDGAGRVTSSAAATDRVPALT